MLQLNKISFRQQTSTRRSQWSITCMILVKPGVLQSSVLDPVLFIVYINNLPQELSCNAKIFADNTSLFSAITIPAISLSNLNEDLR